MPAWIVLGPWSSERIRHYQHRTAAGVGRLLANSRRLTCEDLALHVVIAFAHYYQLPLRIRNGANQGGITPDSADSLPELRNLALRTTGAGDLIRYENTLSVPGSAASVAHLQQARPGDLIHMQYTDYGHIQLVTQVVGGRIYVAQGNLDSDIIAFRSGDHSDPSDRHAYAGKHVVECYYDADGTYYKRSRTTAEWQRQDYRPFQQQRGMLRRWNFLGWNSILQAQSGSSMRGPNLGEHRRLY